VSFRKTSYMPQTRFLGCPGQAEGCLMEYIVMPDEKLFPSYMKLTADNGSISEPLAIGCVCSKKSGELKGLKQAYWVFGSHRDECYAGCQSSGY